MPTATKKPAIGDPVYFEGQPCRIVGINTDSGRVRFDTELQHTRPAVDPVTREMTGSMETLPRFQHLGALSDLKWSDELHAWYMWGRVLGKGRGARHRDSGDMQFSVGDDQRAIVAALRDRELLPARKTRQRGQAPAGGEHLNLYKTLFHGRKVNWKQELDNVRRGEGLSTNAKQCATAYAAEFVKPLPDGYAAPGANDSYAGEG